MNSAALKPFLTGASNNIETPATAPRRMAKPSQPTRYILEGGIIKVYAPDENGVLQCVRMIPLSAAPMDILCKVECTNFQDAMLLEEAKQKRAGGDGNGLGYDKSGKCSDADL